ncbi:cytochrome b [Pseudacidovorax sp. 1753]|uniref:cytochrome b/b6 domain-containing protein n=1 Tax=Pseudacidovorax sp. 1753 TaxID=3156419 RepID=UPI003394AAD6
MSKRSEAAPQTCVWSRSVRLLHLGLIASVTVAWVFREDLGPAHEVAGYVALAAAALRSGIGLAGRGYARFGQFVRSRAATLGYARQVLRGTAPRYIGHNPLGGWMVLALLGCIGLLGASGWLYTTDLFWGYGWLAWLHAALGWTLLALVALHVGGVVFTSIAHRENLVKAMLTGRKAPPGPGDVD